MRVACNSSVENIFYGALNLRYFQLFALLLLCCSQCPAHAESLDEQTFRAMSPCERYRFVHDFSFAQMDSVTAHHVLKRMKEITQENGDFRSAMVTNYRTYTEMGVLYPTGAWDVMFEALANFESGAKQGGFEVEEVVGYFYHNFELFNYERLSHEKFYVAIQKTMAKMEAMGFERFEDYQPHFMMYLCINFMWDLGDYEKAYRYLSFAERFLQPTRKNYRGFTIMLNQLQTYWHQKQDYPRAIEYAQKIQRLYQNLPFDDPETAWRSRFWQGFSSLSIAEMLLEQGDSSQVERCANEGHALSQVQDPKSSVYIYLGEYEALQVYVPIKLAFGKLSEAGQLLQRAAAIKKRMGVCWEVGVFKHIKFYENYARYHEMCGHPADALRYTQLARVLQDSLDQRNDIRKFERIRQRLAAEKYAEQLHLLEGEKEIQKWLSNAAFALLALLLLATYYWLRSQRHVRRQKEVELGVAQNGLTAMMNGFQEKSALAENLRLEMGKMAANSERPQYLEQLVHSTILTNDDWLRFRNIFEKVHPDFIAELKLLHPGLTPAELRYLVLEKLGLSTHEMANMLGVSDNTIRQTRVRFRRKMVEI